jgi:predicted AAA+ superfamily ATPase
LDYQKRVVDDVLERRLSSTGAVVIEGPKASGKTTTARQISASEVLLDVDQNARETIRVDPELVLQGDTPRLIDEWQLEPDIWNHIRRTIDDRGEPGQFILTGSAVPADDITRHTGAGRLTRILMRPMSLYEMDVSTGEISLSKLLDGESPSCKDPGISIEELAKEISMGGWPIHLNQGLSESMDVVRGYLDEIQRTDIERVDNTQRDPRKVGALLKSLARNVTTTATATTLASDTAQADEQIHKQTAREYLDVLSRLMIVEDQPAWAPHLRSKVRLRKSSKRHFVDPSLAVAALGASPEKLLNDLNYMGLLFESMVIRDLRVYAQPLDANVYHYQDETGLEVDAIVETRDGRWGAFEIKLGPGRVDEGAESLLKFANKIDTEKCGEPEILGVITGKGYGTVRDDNIAVIPIGSLGP